MRGLGDRLGPIFAQLPPGYSPAFLDDLTNFLEACSRSKAPLALEVRHPDWFREPHASQLTALLEQLGVGRVLLDTRPIYTGADDPQLQSERRKPKLPLQLSVTASFSLIRFISHPNPDFNRSFLEEWVTFVDQWLRQGKKIYFLFTVQLKRDRLVRLVTSNRCCYSVFLYHLFLGTASLSLLLNSVCSKLIKTSIKTQFYLLYCCQIKTDASVLP